jgi:hypothetical protein
VAYLKKADRDSVDVYAMDLAKLGTDHNAFIDLAILAEEQERVCTAEAIRVTDKPDDGKSEVNEKFSHITPEDVDIVDLPRISMEIVQEMSSQEVDKHFTRAPLKGIEILNHLNDVQKDKMRRFLIENRDMFALDPKKPGRANTEPMTIETGNAQPRAFPHRSTMPHMRPVMEAHINSMLKYGIIRHSESPWAAAVLLIPKNGGEARVAVDLRLLNEGTARFQ